MAKLAPNQVFIPAIALQRLGKLDLENDLLRQQLATLQARLQAARKEIAILKGEQPPGLEKVDQSERIKELARTVKERAGTDPKANGESIHN